MVNEIENTSGKSLDKSKISFVDMCEDNMDIVYQLELDGFPHPWTKGCFRDELKNDLSHYKIMYYDNKPVAYAGIWVMLDEAHVTKIAVSSDMRGNKLGKMIMKFMMSVAKNNGADRMTLEVRESNIIAQNLYKSLGFTVAGIRKKYYTDTKENGIIMWMDI